MATDYDYDVIVVGEALLGCDTPEAAARTLRSWETATAAITCGASGVLLESEGVPAQSLSDAPAPRVVDQTGGGDVFVGTVTARLALGDPITATVELAVAAATLSVGGRGGTGAIPTLARTAAHREGAPCPG
ncbi:carbohydrate kinase family protein [Lipingzhangella halophila]|nr:carbohydrate kinase family protein [Lipingzhangella halophila]